MPNIRARLIDMCGGLNPNQHDHGRNSCHRRSRVHSDAELTMVCVAFDRVEVGHLNHNQKRQQRQTQQSDRSKSTWLRSAISAELGLKCRQSATLT